MLGTLQKHVRNGHINGSEVSDNLIIIVYYLIQSYYVLPCHTYCVIATFIAPHSTLHLLVTLQ